jgi:transposase
MQDAKVIERIRRKYSRMQPVLNERSRRLWAATEALEVGWGGVTAVTKGTGMSPTTVRAGIAELKRSERSRGRGKPMVERIRRPGGGRKRLTDRDPGLASLLESLVEPTARGEPETPLRWTIKSTRRLARELARRRFPVSHKTVAALLHERGFSLQGNRKTREGASEPDRNAQFEYLNRHVQNFLRRRQPAVSVDTKKKELVGDFKNGGREYRRRGHPENVRVHDFIDRKLGKAIPYGVYDLLHNEGWVSVGVDHDTAQFAVNAIRRWWRCMGRARFPRAQQLLITADSGGSNSPRCRLWKVALQRFADETGLTVTICHFPPGTSKWNKIEHRMFSFIAQNWRGKPLVTLRTIVELIGHTRTSQGLIIRAALDTNKYPDGIEVDDDELATVRLKPHTFHGDWNYTITPRRKI